MTVENVRELVRPFARLLLGSPLMVFNHLATRIEALDGGMYVYLFITCVYIILFKFKKPKKRTHTHKQIHNTNTITYLTQTHRDPQHLARVPQAHQNTHMNRYKQR